MEPSKHYDFRFVTSVVLITGILSFASFCNHVKAQLPPAIAWERSYGGSEDEIFYSLEATVDHGFLLIGQSSSADGDITDPWTSPDSWIVKVDSAGAIQWQRSLGGSGQDHSYSAQQLPDHNYVVSIESKSDDGDSPGNHGAYDFLLVKLDTDGNTLWARDYGGSLHDHPCCIRATKDGGIIMAGGTASNDGDVSGHHGSTDYFDMWVMKLDTFGNIAWCKSIGGSKSDFGLYIQELGNGGYVLVGQTESDDGDFSGHHGTTPNSDVVVVRLDAAGNIVWKKLYGGSGDEAAHYVWPNRSGSCLIIGNTESTDGDVTETQGGKDIWLLKLGASGNLKWQHTYGGSAGEVGRCVRNTSDGGLIITGETSSDDGPVTGNHGMQDFWAAKLTSSGSVIWEQSYGGSDNDAAKTIIPLSNGEFAVAGTSRSNDMDVSDHHGSAASADFWLVKLTDEGVLNLVRTPDQQAQSQDSRLFDFSLCRNPVENTACLNIFAWQECEPLLELRDAFGHLLFRGTTSCAAGSNMATCDLSRYSAGTYFITMKLGSNVITRKFQKM